MRRSHYLNKPADPAITAAPRDVLRREFAKRLSGILRDKGWNQSELARRMYGSTVDGEGKKVAKGRDNVSGWTRGLVLPSDREMAKLCSALDVDRGELVPYELVPNVDQKIPPFEVKQVGPDRFWLKVNQQVTAKQYMAITKILTVPEGE